MKTQNHVSVASIQRNFEVNYEIASAIYNYLIDKKLIREMLTFNSIDDLSNSNIKLPLKVYLLDINHDITGALHREFDKYSDVEIINDDFAHFMNTHKDIECIVSPANSFGCMDGGYDLAITDYFGLEVEFEVQDYIKKYLFGEQPVGSSIMVDIPNTNKKLIHTPTMRLPSPIVDETLIYHCMRSTLITAINGKIKSIVIPAFGGATGKLKPDVIAKNMRQGYEQILSNYK